MLLFYCADDDELDERRRVGIPAGATLWTTLEKAQRENPECLLVVDALAWAKEQEKVSLEPAVESVSGPRVPADIIENLDPYRPPMPITAAGGYVVQRYNGETNLLMIYRRKVWDLPKGKQEDGEPIADCARREVCEEVGAERVHLGRKLGLTRHSYPMGDHQAVKTTYWFAMTTPETNFTPQRVEGIKQVAWTPWQAAKQRVGYATLRDHMNRVEADIIDVD